MVAEEIERVLAQVIDPELRLPLTELDMVDFARLTDSTLEVGISLTIVGCPQATRIEEDVRRVLTTQWPHHTLELTIGVMDHERRQALIQRIRRPKETAFSADSLTRIVAVTSGKGGVGKSTVTSNLAVLAAMDGLRVGLIDADVYGFSIPGILGLQGQTPTRLDDVMLPPVAWDVKTVSIGMFVPAHQPVSWRGPMLHRTVSQFLSDVHFGDLDYLFIDLPPGTGDVAISLGQLLPQSEVIVVTTPQQAASDVAERSGLLARQVGQRVMGVVETMSPTVTASGERLALFGEGGGQDVAKRLDVPLIGQIPLSSALREGGDRGVPVVIGSPDDPSAHALRDTWAALRKQRESLVGQHLPIRPAGRS